MHYVGEWLQVDFRFQTQIVGVITQGRPAGYDDWVTAYKILYGDSDTKLESIMDYCDRDKVRCCAIS